ncbi:MAG: hypothetical protein FJ098_12795 [Deltaproteobacteria bacterium]|nr:hypothetical protein [Deltaproteobacteria bacterium]
MKATLRILLMCAAVVCGVQGCELDGGGAGGDAVEGAADGGGEPCARPEGECSKGDCIQVCCANAYGSCEHDWGFLEACKLDCAEDPCAFQLLPGGGEEDTIDPGVPDAGPSVPSSPDAGSQDAGPSCPSIGSVSSASCVEEGLVCTYGEVCDCPGFSAGQCEPEVVCECRDECSGLCFLCDADPCE